MREDEGKTEEDTDTDEEGGADVDDEDGKGQQGFTNNGEPEFKPKKVKLAKTLKKLPSHTHTQTPIARQIFTPKLQFHKNRSKSTKLV